VKSLNVNNVYFSIKINSNGAETEGANGEGSAEKTVSTKQIGNQMRNLLKEMLDPAKGMTDEQKEKYERKIRQKLENGEKVTGEEMRYLQIHDPELYAEASRIQVQRQSLENRLKCCKSKQEVQEAYNDAISHVDTKDTMAGALMAAFGNVLKEFKKTSAYQGLPQKTDKNKNGKDANPAKQNEKLNSDEADTTTETTANGNQIEDKYYPEKDTFSAVDIGV
jgi:hypothetical protein